MLTWTCESLRLDAIISQVGTFPDWHRVARGGTG